VVKLRRTGCECDGRSFSIIEAAELGKVCKKEAYKMLSEIDISDGNRLLCALRSSAGKYSLADF